MSDKHQLLIDVVVVILAIAIVLIGLHIIKSNTSKQISELEAAQSELREKAKALEAEIKKRESELAEAQTLVSDLEAKLKKANDQTLTAQAALNYVQTTYQKKTITELTLELEASGVEIAYSPALGLYTLPETSARTLALSFFELKSTRPAYEAVLAESAKKDELISGLNRLYMASASEITALKERLDQERALNASLQHEVAVLKNQGRKTNYWAYIATAGIAFALGAIATN